MTTLATGIYTVTRQADGSLTIELAPAGAGTVRDWTLSAAQLQTVRRFLIFNRDLASLFHHLTGGTP